MPQITAYANKTDHERWMRVQRKADVIKWLLDRYEAGDVELPTLVRKPAKNVPKVSDDELLEELPATDPSPGVIKTPEEARKAVEPMAPHQNFFKKPKKKK